MQLLGTDKDVVAAAARSLACPPTHQYTPKPYCDIFADNFYPGVHPQARIHTVAIPGLRLLLSNLLAIEDVTDTQSGESDCATTCAPTIWAVVLAGGVGLATTMLHRRL